VTGGNRRIKFYTLGNFTSCTPDTLLGW